MQSCQGSAPTSGLRSHNSDGMQASALACGCERAQATSGYCTCSRPALRLLPLVCFSKHALAHLVTLTTRAAVLA